MNTSGNRSIGPGDARGIWTTGDGVGARVMQELDIHPDLLRVHGLRALGAHWTSELPAAQEQLSRLEQMLRGKQRRHDEATTFYPSLGPEANPIAGHPGSRDALDARKRATGLTLSDGHPPGFSRRSSPRFSRTGLVGLAPPPG